MPKGERFLTHAVAAVYDRRLEFGVSLDKFQGLRSVGIFPCYFACIISSYITRFCCHGISN